MLSLDHLLTSLQLRVLVAERRRMVPDWKVDELVLPFNKIYYALDGEVSYAIDGAEFHMRRNDVALMPAKCRHRVWQDPRKLFEKIWIHFDARVLGMVDLFDVIPCPPPVAMASEDVHTLLKSVLEEFNRGEGHRAFSPLVINGALSLAIGKILRAAYGQKDYGALPIRTSRGHVAKVLCYIAENYTRPLTLEKLADVAHLHPTYFSNLFTKSTGLSPMAFLRRFRVERAKGLLVSSDLRVSEVAARVGFNDVFYFSRAFKQLTGTAPAHFQESARRTSSN